MKDQVSTSALLHSLTANGFIIIPKVFTPESVERANRDCNALVDEQAANSEPRYGNLGVLVDFTFQEPALVGFLFNSRLFGTLGELFGDGVRLWKGYIVSKEAGAPPTYWHQDWGFWGHDTSFRESPPQIFVMIYLTNTTRQNGCLRVIPGSHRRVHPLHERLGAGHDDLRVVNGAPEFADLYRPVPYEQDVPVAAGDLVVGDARLLHAVYANTSTHRRNLLVFDVFPCFLDLPEDIQRYVSARMPRPANSMDSDLKERIAKVLPDFPSSDGACASWQRYVDLDVLRARFDSFSGL